MTLKTTGTVNYTSECAGNPVTGNQRRDAIGYRRKHLTSQRGLSGMSEGDPNGAQGLSLFAAFHHAPPDVNAQTNFVDFGAVYVGLIPGRDTDVTGFYFATGWFSGDLRDSQRAAGQPGQEYESVLELNYRWNALPWFYLQPDIQGFINPGAAHQFGDALVLAMQFGVPF